MATDDEQELEDEIQTLYANLLADLEAKTRAAIADFRRLAALADDPAARAYALRSIEGIEAAMANARKALSEA